MNYSFELRRSKKNKNGLIPIRLVVTHNRLRIRKSIDAKTLLEDWDKSDYHINNPRVSTNKFYKQYKDFNKEIRLVKDKVENIFDFFEYNNIPFTKNAFLEKFQQIDVHSKISFFDAYEEYIRVSEFKRAKATITKYKSVRNFLMDFVAFTQYPLRFDNIDYRFEEAFMEYCFKERKTLNNYYGKLISTLKAFMQWSFDRGYHNHLDFKRIKRKEDDIEVIYLTLDEVKKLYEYDFPTPALNRSRDFFCFLCFTGQRHSDIYQIRDANVQGNYLNFTVKKTKETSHQVFLNDKAKEVLNKYRNTKYAPIPKITSQKLNKNIQRCCEIIGLTEEVVLTRFVGSKRLDQTFRKCDIITSHVGRKTYITNGYALGIDERVLRLNTGSKDEKSFKRYLNIPTEYQENELTKWGF
ncbi:MAG TPA: phage integrase SAM-like domain-containing protein [Flavobacteriaceae bacterium]|nr:phage integrase SAM-like domain-containing protein [Flavobacteriaceae bacterium]